MLKDKTSKYTHGEDRKMHTTRVPRGASVTYSRTIQFDSPHICTIGSCENRRHCRDSNLERLKTGKSVLRAEYVWYSKLNNNSTYNEKSELCRNYSVFLLKLDEFLFMTIVYYKYFQILHFSSQMWLLKVFEMCFAAPALTQASGHSNTPEYWATFWLFNLAEWKMVVVWKD